MIRYFFSEASSWTTFPRVINEWLDETKHIWVMARMQSYIQCIVPFVHFRQCKTQDGYKLEVDRVRTARMIYSFDCLPLKKRYLIGVMCACFIV